MTIEYYGKAPPGVFIHQKPSLVHNGSLVTSGLCSLIADNQTWCATQDVDASNVYTNPKYNRTHVDGTDDPIEFDIEVNPFAKHVEVYCWIVRDYSFTVDRPWIQVTNPELLSNERRQTLLSGGSDQTGKSGVVPRVTEAQWIAFKGTNHNAQHPVSSYDANAVPVRGATDMDVSTWKEVKIQVSTSDASVIIYAVYARVVPFSGRLTSTQGS